MATYYTDEARAQANALFNGNPDANEILMKINIKIQGKPHNSNIIDSIVVVQNNPNTRITFEAIPVNDSDWEIPNITAP